MANQIKVTKKMLKKKVRITPYAIICGTVLLAYTFVLLFPVAFGLMQSLKSMVQFRNDPAGFPDFSKFLLERNEYMYTTADGGTAYIQHIFANYEKVIRNFRYDYKITYYGGFDAVPMEGGFDSLNEKGWNGTQLMLFCLFNTVWTAVASTLVPVFWCAALGYVCAKYKYKLVGLIYGIVIFRISCPIIGGGSAMLSIQRQFGLYDTIPGYFLYCSGSLSMYFLIMYAYFQGLPDSYMEAAEIDGASQLRILFTIAIPLAGTVMSASLVVSVITAWNDYNTPLLYLPSYPTMAFGIFNYKLMQSANTGPEAVAASMYLAIPAFIFFVAFRKKLMGNLSVGGIKG